MFSDINKEGLLSSIINAAFRDLENIFLCFSPLAKATQTAQRISGKTPCAESDGRVHSAGIVKESLLFWGSRVFLIQNPFIIQENSWCVAFRVSFSV